MMYGFGRGQGGRGGAGFGFRGSSPPWPYVGRGRGGLPRCSYYFGTGISNIPGINYEQEMSFFKTQSQELSRQLHDIEARIKDLESRTDKQN